MTGIFDTSCNSNLLSPDQENGFNELMKRRDIKELITTRPEVTPTEAILIKYYIEHVVDLEMKNIFELWKNEPNEDNRTRLWYFHNALESMRTSLLNKLPIQEEEHE